MISISINVTGFLVSFFSVTSIETNRIEQDKTEINNAADPSIVLLLLNHLLRP